MKHGYFVAALVLTALVLIVSGLLYPRLPEMIPTHWDIHGHVNGYATKAWGVFLIPIIMICIIALLRVLSWLSPRHFEVEPFRPTFNFIVFLVVALMAYIQALALWSAIRGETNMGRFFIAGLFLFFAALGNVLGKVRRNFWVGVRTPWTLASERVWNDTHRFAARLFVLVGVIGFIFTIAGGPPIIAFILLMIAGALSVIYSLVEYKRLEKRGEI